MAQFLSFLDQNAIVNYVAVDDISCIIAYKHHTDGILCNTAIYTKTDPTCYISAQLLPVEVIAGQVITKGKLL